MPGSWLIHFSVRRVFQAPDCAFVRTKHAISFGWRGAHRWRGGDDDGDGKNNSDNNGYTVLGHIYSMHAFVTPKNNDGMREDVV